MLTDGYALLFPRPGSIAPYCTTGIGFGCFVYKLSISLRHLCRDRRCYCNRARSYIHSPRVCQQTRSVL